MKTILASLAAGVLILAGCIGTTYSLPNGTAVPGWATGVVAATEDSMPDGQEFTPEQVRQSLYAGSLTCVMKGTPMFAGAPPEITKVSEAANAEFCRQIDPWLQQNDPGGLLGFGAESAPEPAPIVKTWGETVTESGVSITVSNARSEAPSDYDGAPTDPEPGKRFVAVDVTIANNSSVEHDNLGFWDLRTDVGTASGRLDGDMETPPATYLPGDSYANTNYYEVDADATELRMQVITGTPEGADFHLRGPIPAAGTPPPETTPAPQPPVDNTTPGYDPEGGVEFDERGCPIDVPNPTPYCAGDTEPVPQQQPPSTTVPPTVPPGEGGMDQYEYGCQQGYIPPEQC